MTSQIEVRQKLGLPAKEQQLSPTFDAVFDPLCIMSPLLNPLKRARFDVALSKGVSSSDTKANCQANRLRYGQITISQQQPFPC